jgi:hypothetical protein
MTGAANMRFQKPVTLILTAACVFTFVLTPGLSTVFAQEEAKAEKKEPTDEERAARLAAFRRSRGPSIAKHEIGEKVISVQSAQLKAEGVDYESVGNVQPGEYLVLTKSNAIKMKTDFDLSFGDVKAKYGNAAPNYPGVYSLWLLKKDAGWELAFNEKADVWGTQYNPDHNIGKVDIAYSTVAFTPPPAAGEETSGDDGKKKGPNDHLIGKLRFRLFEENDGMNLEIKFGKHLWTTPFTVEQ